MARTSPLLPLHQQAEALLDTYGPTAPMPGAEASDPASVPVRVVQTFAEPDLEYAAIRRGCGLIDLPTRGTIEVTGPDRLEFLGRMLTQELKGFAPWSVRSSFWLSRRGRIDADLRLINLPDRLWIDVDVHAASSAARGLSAYVIAENCAVHDRSAAMHRLALHGHTAGALLARAADGPASAGGPVESLRPGMACLVEIAGHECIVDRDDATGDPGFNLLMPVEAARAVWSRLVEIGCPGLDDPLSMTTPPYHMRPIGWAAFNVARIEAGTPLYFLDFGPDSLPHETSLLDSRVSFIKGCYLGQEIVARMHSLGQPKQTLVALKIDAPPRSTGDDPTADADIPEILQPVTGAGVFAPPPDAAEDAIPRPGACGEPIGAVTSSAISPMLSGTPLCFAMVKTAVAQPGRRLFVDAGGALIPGRVCDGLRAWRRSEPPRT